MHYDKGPHITVGILKDYLQNVPDDVKINICIGDRKAEAHYLVNQGGELTLAPDCYMQDAPTSNWEAVISLMRPKN